MKLLFVALLIAASPCVFSQGSFVENGKTLSDVKESLRSTGEFVYDKSETMNIPCEACLTGQTKITILRYVHKKTNLPYVYTIDDEKGTCYISELGFNYEDKTLIIEVFDKKCGKYEDKGDYLFWMCGYKGVSLSKSKEGDFLVLMVLGR